MSRQPPEPSPQQHSGDGRRSYFVTVAALLTALVVLGTVGLVAGIAIGGGRFNGFGSASAQAIFDMPYTRGVRTAEFQEVLSGGGSSITGSGVIEFAPEHRYSETWSDVAGNAGYREFGYRQMDIGGVQYTEKTPGSQYEATGYDGLAAIQFLGWDGGPPPSALQIAGETVLEGQQAWVLKDLYSSDRWVVGQRSGDPLEAVLAGGHETYTFRDWGRAAAVKAPAAPHVSTARYSSADSALVVAPPATVRVLKEEEYSATGRDDAAGFRTVALEISYRNTTSAAAQFDNILSLVSPEGVSALAFTIMVTPSLRDGRIAPGQTTHGWDAFTVPRRATRFHLLFGDQAELQDPHYLISIPVQVPG